MKVAHKNFNLLRTWTVCVAITILLASTAFAQNITPSPLAPNEMFERVDQVIDAARVSLLAELKRAKQYRVAHRDQDPEAEKAAYGITPRLLNFDKSRLHSVCEGVAKALFKEQRRITAMPPPTAWVKRDGEIKVRGMLQATYPRCTSDRADADESLLGRLEAKGLRDLGDKLMPESQVYRLNGGMLSIEPGTSRVARANTIIEERYLFARIYMGAGICPVAKFGTSIGKQDIPFNPISGRPMRINGELATPYSAPLRIDGRVALIEMSTIDPYVLGYDLSQYMEPEDEAKNDPWRLQLRFHWYPSAPPLPDENELKVYMPPFSPLMPPISRKDNAWVAPTLLEEAAGAPQRSVSLAPTCFIYFK